MKRFISFFVLILSVIMLSAKIVVTTPSTPTEQKPHPSTNYTDKMFFGDIPMGISISDFKARMQCVGYKYLHHNKQENMMLFKGKFVDVNDTIVVAYSSTTNLVGKVVVITHAIDIERINMQYAEKYGKSVLYDDYRCFGCYVVPNGQITLTMGEYDDYSVNITYFDNKVNQYIKEERTTEILNNI